MNKNKITIGASILAAVIVIAGAASFSYAFSRGGGNGFFKDGTGKNQNQEEMKAERTALEQAFTNNDYAAWKTIMEEQKNGMAKRLEDFSAKINEETFSKISEMKKLISEGKIEEANVIRQELGEISFGFGNDFGRGIGKHQGFVDADNNGVCDNLEE
jgi:hypothetical protein